MTLNHIVTLLCSLLLISASLPQHTIASLYNSIFVSFTNLFPMTLPSVILLCVYFPLSTYITVFSICLFCVLFSPSLSFCVDLYIYIYMTAYICITGSPSPPSLIVIFSLSLFYLSLSFSLSLVSPFLPFTLCVSLYLSFSISLFLS